MKQSLTGTAPSSKALPHWLRTWLSVPDGRGRSRFSLVFPSWAGADRSSATRTLWLMSGRRSVVDQLTATTLTTSGSRKPECNLGASGLGDGLAEDGEVVPAELVGHVWGDALAGGLDVLVQTLGAQCVRGPSPLGDVPARDRSLSRSDAATRRPGQPG